MVNIKLCVFFLIVGLCSTVDGSCFMQKTTDCIYKGIIIKDKANYQSIKECINCSCSGGLLQCCSIGMHISSASTDCKVVPDGPCSEKAVLITDETQPCPGGFSMTGR
ncbi:uncharacterized protein LOC134707436 [Mytilus trossulus]|uniref:uncharacterized protein LOC134707436 n=1 Tax=Mytilus trossulus TaxID=6551 RepID=UPI003004307F